MTIADDLKATAAALASGWPIENLNRARRVRAEEQRTMSDTDDYKDLIERATPILRELRRACGNDSAKFEGVDDDLAAALLAVEPDALVTELPEIGEWSVATPEFRIYTSTKPERAK